MNANADREEEERIQNTVLYGANNVNKADFVQTRKVFDSCLKVDSGIGGTVSVYVGHGLLLRGVSYCCDFREW